MFIGYFTERPFQDRDAQWYRHFVALQDLDLSNAFYRSDVAAELHNRYFDEKQYIEAMGFDGVMLNSHHSTPFCMGGGAMNLEAAILARITERLRIILLGNVLPIWEDPLWLVEELSIIDVISRGRLVSGFVRGTGRESLVHNAQPPYNSERFQEAHDFIVKAWTTPGPFRWEGDHFQYRYVNPWALPVQKPHPPIWSAGILSKSTVSWAAAHRYPYVMLDSQLHLTRQVFDFYSEQAREHDYEAGPQHFGHVLRLHVDETEELAYETGRKMIEGPGNLFLDGSNGKPNPWAQNLPGMNPRRTEEMLPTWQYLHTAKSRGVSAIANADRAQKADFELEPAKDAEEHDRRRRAIFDEQISRHATIVGTPDTVIPKIRHVLETLRPGNVIFWHGDGDFTHEDTMRGVRLMGEYVLPAVREMAAELELPGAFDVDPATNAPLAAGVR